jgi:DNA-directed RNA polymerase alpha subunit
METAEKFKNSPMHDKRAIIQLLDLLNPAQMCMVVELAQKLIENSIETEKEKQLEETEQEKLRNTPIYESELTVRCLNCLKYELGIRLTSPVKSLEKAISRTQLRNTRGLGRKSFFLIEELFENAGMIMRDN